MAKMTYIGHGSLRFVADEGKTVYVDPYWEGDYSLPADLILVTHQHHDHNQVDKVTQQAGCRIITEADALAGGTHNSFDLGWIQIDSVLANNKNHDPKLCVGYILAFDGLKIYCAGDTSTTADMKKMRGIDYALLPIDGIYNMDAAEATQCAHTIDAKRSIPIHTDPTGYSEDKVAQFTPKSRLVIRHSETIDL